MASASAAERSTRQTPPLPDSGNARYSVSSSLAVRDALRAGFGISLIPYPYVEEDLKAGRLLTALEDWRTVETTLYAVYPSGQHVAPKIRALMTFLSDTFAGRG